MSWRRQQQNYEAKKENRRVHSAARHALERYRESGDTSGFPDLRKRVTGIHGLSLAGYADADINPRLTQEEYDGFKAAYEQSEEGQAERRRWEDWLRTDLDDSPECLTEE